MMLTRNPGWIGVDIGTHTVKLAQIERRGPHFALKDAVIVSRSAPWPDTEGLSSSPQPSSGEMVAARSLGEQFSGRLAAATMPMAICELRSMQVPEARDSERRSLIGRELAAANAEGGVREFDYWHIDNAAESQQAVRENVSVVSIATQWARQIAQDHTPARLVCQAIDAVPLTLARAVTLADPGAAARSVAAIDWGYSRATLCVIADGRPIFVRPLRDCGFRTVLASLTESLAVSLDEARQVVTEHGLPNPSSKSAGDLQVAVAEVAASALSNIVDEIKRTLSYLRSHRAVLVPDHVCLFGGGATLRNIDHYLTNKAGITTKRWDLGSALFHSDSAGACPVALLGPAIALSSLAWERS